GYRSWKAQLQLQRWGNLPVPRAIKKAGLFSLALLEREHTREYEWLRRNTRQLPVFWSGAEGFTETHKQSLLSHRLKKKLAGLSSWDVLAPIHDRFQQKAWENSPLQWMTYADLNLRLPELLLMRVDKMSMAVGVEARVPFLDHKFVELALSIPQAVKTRDGNLKCILKEAVSGLIPDEILHRKKQGFGVPIHEWFFDRLGQFARKELADFCKQTDYFDGNAVMKLLDGSDQRAPWYLLNLALWWKQYIGGRPKALAIGAD
ncbi:MAG TPA: asparagine synthase C-terminal domain-containing protein, partial [Terriglobales bacterium]|nr:asparagine synthase C-terminal domain-containing protein [Terriglobales bacterium]